MQPSATRQTSSSVPETNGSGEIMTLHSGVRSSRHGGDIIYLQSHERNSSHQSCPAMLSAAHVATFASTAGGIHTPTTCTRPPHPFPRLRTFTTKCNSLRHLLRTSTRARTNEPHGPRPHIPPTCPIGSIHSPSELHLFRRTSHTSQD